MNRSSDREMRLVAIEGQVREIRELQEDLATKVDRINERLDLLTSAVLKLSHELGAQRARYPLD